MDIRLHFLSLRGAPFYQRFDNVSLAINIKCFTVEICVSFQRFAVRIMTVVRKFVFSLAVLSVLSYSESANTAQHPIQRIIGGTEAEPGSAPYMVALMASRFRGGGIIINKYYVLTTAACVPDDNFYVLAGVFDISSGEYDQRLPVDRVTRHIKDDIALIRLGVPIFFDDLVKSAVLPPRGFIHSGDVVVFGWGSSSRSYSILNKAVLDIVNYDRCQLIFGGAGASPLNERNMCTGPLSGGIAPCTGDAGSPIVQTNANGEDEVVGLVSWGFIPCGGEGNPQVHIRLSAYIDWIVENLR